MLIALIVIMMVLLMMVIGNNWTIALSKRI
jgi:hypothetical protein